MIEDEVAAQPTDARSSAVSKARFAASINRDVLSTMAVRIVAVLGSVLGSVLTARYLSPSSRGEYFVVYTLAQTLAQFGNLGLHSSNTYLVARDRTLAGPLLANSLWTALIAGGFGSSIVVLALKAQDDSWAVSGLWLVVVLAPAILFYLLGVNLLVGLRRIATFNKFQLASNYVVLLCLIAAAIAGAGPSGFLAASALGWTVIGGGLVLALREGAASLRFRPDIFRNGLRFALKAYAATLFAFLVMRGNVFLLNELTSSEQVGYYSVATQIADAMAILPQSVALVLFPALVIASGGQFRTTLKNMVVVGVVLAAACIGVGLCAETFIRIVFGEKFLPSVPALLWLLPSVFFLGLTSIPSQYLAASGFPGAVVFVWLGGVVVSLSLGWLLIPFNGQIGAAVATSLTHLCMLVAISALCIKHARASGGGFEVKPVVVADEPLS